MRFLYTLAIYGHGSFLGHMTKNLFYEFMSEALNSLALIGHAVSEKKISENICHIHNLHISPLTGTDKPVGSKKIKKY